jgi:hypothetical protein
MTSDRKKPTAGFWITVALVAALVVYPLSWGPVFWLHHHAMLPKSAIESGVFSPMGWAILTAPAPIQRVTVWYLGLWDW